MNCRHYITIDKNIDKTFLIMLKLLKEKSKTEFLYTDLINLIER